MNLYHLYYILSIAEEENISHAADKLFISRPALNHYLLELENKLGQPLFKRINHKMLPTYAGKTYIEGIKKILDIQNQTNKALQEIMDNKSGNLSLGITHGTGSMAFTQLFPIFHKKYPNFTVNLIEGNISELEKALLEGQIDLAVGGQGFIHPTIEHIKLSRVEILLVLPRNHRLAYLATPEGEPHSVIDINLLKDDSFILRTSDTKTRKITDAYFEKHGIIPKIIIECRLGQMVYNMVLNGIGVAFLNENELIPGDGLPCFSLSPNEWWNRTIVFRKETHFTEAEKYLVQLFKDYYTRLFNRSSSAKKENI
jgi:DNA-binding transcriptional LysR family regulator